MPCSPSRRVPVSPAVGIALIAVFVALGGVGYAAVKGGIPDGAGIFHACVDNKTGALRIVSDPASCRKRTGRGKHRSAGERAFEWSQQGPAGVNGLNGINGVDGVNGAMNVTVRQTTGTIPGTCVPDLDTGFYHCSGKATIVAPCNSGERATGGGYGGLVDSYGLILSPVPVDESRPDSFSGVPTGWAVTANYASATGAPAVTEAQITVYVVCVSP